MFPAKRLLDIGFFLTIKELDKRANQMTFFKKPFQKSLLLSWSALIILWSFFTYEAISGLMLTASDQSKYVGFNMFAVSIVGFYCCLKEKRLLMLVLAIIMFVPVGLYFIGANNYLAFIGIANLYIIVAGGIRILLKKFSR